MMKSMKLGLKLLRYAWGIKTTLLSGGIFFLLGLLSFTMSVQTWYLGGYLLMVLAVYPAQLLSSLTVSNLVQTSPWKKALQTSVPTALTAGAFALTYGGALIISLLRLNARPEMREDMVMILVLFTFEIFLIMTYCGIAYKTYVLGTALFIIVFVIGSRVIQIGAALGVFRGVSVFVAACSGFAAMLLGSAVQYGLSLMLYKRALSKNAQYPGLRKYI